MPTTRQDLTCGVTDLAWMGGRHNNSHCKQPERQHRSGAIGRVQQASQTAAGFLFRFWRRVVLLAYEQLKTLFRLGYGGWVHIKLHLEPLQ